MIFEELIAKAHENKPKRLVVAGASDRGSLEAAVRAKSDGVAEPVLIGHGGWMEEIASEANLGLDGLRIVHCDSDEEIAVRTMDLMNAGEMDALLKGRIHTAVLMKEGFRRGLRKEGRILSQVVAAESDHFERPLMITDCGIIPYPTFEQRIAIVKNAVIAMRALGIDEPRVAALAASEEADAKFPCSIDAARLRDENRFGGALEGYGIVEGPMDLGAAIDAHSAEVKRVAGAVAGRADILLAPDLIAANLLIKSLIYFIQARIGGCVMGGAVPIAMVSRASPAMDKYRSVLVALACSNQE